MRTSRTGQSQRDLRTLGAATLVGLDADHRLSGCAPRPAHYCTWLTRRNKPMDSAAEGSGRSSHGSCAVGGAFVPYTMAHASPFRVVHSCFVLSSRERTRSVQHGFNRDGHCPHPVSLRTMYCRGTLYKPRWFNPPSPKPTTTAPALLLLYPPS